VVKKKAQSILEFTELLVNRLEKIIAVSESFIGSSWQMCHVHLIRQALKI
jgi:transposase-like protein